MITPAPGRRRGFSGRRRGLLAIVALLLAGVAWLHFTGAAGISGMAVRDMDWNGDGQVTQPEILQSFYAVTVKKSQDGARQCSAYSWRKTGQPIRVDCRTTIKPETE